MDPLYQKEFIARFNTDKAVHVIDCPETNPVQVNKIKSLTFAGNLSQISPSLVSMGVHPKPGSNGYLRNNLEKKLDKLDTVDGG